MRHHTASFNSTLQKYILTDPDPFGFNNLEYIQSAEESKALNTILGPCIIISASGMGDAGRVKHHIKNTISNPQNTILLSGYCAPGTLGRRLLDGEQSVHIFGEYYNVKADIESILSYSAHADYSELLRFLSCQDAAKVKTIFLVHGEDEAKVSFNGKLIEKGFNEVIIPEKFNEFILD
jgi:metallo-beta-lactamase family protein